MSNIRDEEDIKLSRFLHNIEEKYPEEWKDIYINGEKTNYVCSNYGFIGRKNTNDIFVLRSIRMPNGYYVVTIRHNGKSIRDYVHRIVAKTLIPKPNRLSELQFSELEVNHKNGEKWNNTIWNLEWVTSNENKKHAYSIGLSKQAEESSLSIYDDKTIHNVCSLLEKNTYSIPKISKITSVNEQTIYDILYGRSWKVISKLYNLSKYTPKNLKYSKNDIDVMKEMLLNKNETIENISIMTKIPKSTIYYYKEKMNI